MSASRARSPPPGPNSWQPISPVDGVSDARSESYALPLEGLRPGEHTVIVRVTDLLGNMAAGKATFTTE